LATGAIFYWEAPAEAGVRTVKFRIRDDSGRVAEVAKRVEVVGTETQGPQGPLDKRIHGKWRRNELWYLPPGHDPLKAKDESHQITLECVDGSFTLKIRDEANSWTYTGGITAAEGGGNVLEIDDESLKDRDRSDLPGFGSFAERRRLKAHVGNDGRLILDGGAFKVLFSRE
jgi:hypothetical protein